jgi:hypothetical protein
MSRTVITPTHPVALRVHSRRPLVAALAALVAVGGGAIALPGDDAIAPTKLNASPTAPIILGDPAVQKGAHGGKTDRVILPVFRDPTVRKGAGGS